MKQGTHIVKNARFRCHTVTAGVLIVAKETNANVRYLMQRQEDKACPTNMAHN